MRPARAAEIAFERFGRARRAETQVRPDRPSAVAGGCLDAEAIAEAATRPTMRLVAVKSQTQSDIQALHRARERLVSERTGLINHLRALLLERGIVAPQGRRKLQEELLVFADEDGIEALSPQIRFVDRRLAERMACVR